MIRLPAVTDSPSWWKLLEAQHGKNAFDIGANIGQAATVLAAHFNHVYSYEPCNEAVTILITETPLNVVVIPRAVSNGPNEVELDVTETSIGYGELTTGSRLGWGPVIGHRRVEATTVDNEVDRLGIHPDLVKIDTEGHEVKVLEGAKRLIAKTRTVWMVEVHDRQFDTPIRDLLGRYRIERHDHDYLHGELQADDHYYLIASPDAA